MPLAIMARQCDGRDNEADAGLPATRRDGAPVGQMSSLTGWQLAVGPVGRRTIETMHGLIIHVRRGFSVRPIGTGFQEKIKLSRGVGQARASHIASVNVVLHVNCTCIT